MRSESAVRRRPAESAAMNETTEECFRSSNPVWWAWLDLNQRPHPYQQNAGNRCAAGRFRRSRPTVKVEVKCSHRVQLDALATRRIDRPEKSASSRSGVHDRPPNRAGPQGPPRLTPPTGLGEDPGRWTRRDLQTVVWRLL
jgi:hypothetical protein